MSTLIGNLGLSPSYNRLLDLNSGLWCSQSSHTTRRDDDDVIIFYVKYIGAINFMNWVCASLCLLFFSREQLSKNMSCNRTNCTTVAPSVLRYQLILALLCCLVLLSGGQEESDMINNDMLLNAIHTNEVPVINEAIEKLR